MSEEEVPVRGFQLPRITGGTASIIIFLIGQGIAIFVWMQNEHAQRVELQHQFEKHIADDARSFAEHKAETEKRSLIIIEQLNAKNREQDAVFQRFENTLNQLDVNGTRRLLVLEDRQIDTRKVLDDIAKTVRDNTVKIETNRLNTQRALDTLNDIQNQLRRKP